MVGQRGALAGGRDGPGDGAADGVPSQQVGGEERRGEENMVFWVLLEVGSAKMRILFSWCGELRKWVCSPKHVVQIEFAKLFREQINNPTTLV